MAWDTSRVAIDLGAGSGRAILGHLAGGRLRLQEVHRFHYAPRHEHGHLRWDYEGLIGGLETGLRNAGETARALGGRVVSIGVESWAVDYGLLDAGGRLCEDPIAYRDGRTDGVMERVFERVPRGEVFARTGIQCLPFNTLYQLFAHVRDGLPAQAKRLLMIPDLCHRHLCGSESSETTNASTTQMWNVRAGAWDEELLSDLGLPRALLPDVVQAGTTLGPLLPKHRRTLGSAAVVMAPATHDTGSAVAGTPLNAGWAYISSGTWSLVGVERTQPILSEEAAEHNFTNEVGAFGTVRFLKNVMGLWLLESCRREWDASVEWDGLLEQVAARPSFDGFVFPDDERFFNPASMVSALHEAVRETGPRPPESPTPAWFAKIVLDSLALRYASVLDTLERTTGQPIPGVHVVGGGCLNRYLNQATADASGRTVLAGPVEATATGNWIVQAIAAGEVASLAEGRRLVSLSNPLVRYDPRRSRAWDEARERYRELESARVL
jgi:rhamnulokinase